MKVDFGPLERTSKREVCVSLSFWGGFIPRPACFVTRPARTSGGVQVRAPRSSGSAAARGARPEWRDTRGDRPRAGPLDCDRPLLAAAVEDRSPGRASFGGRPGYGSARDGARVPAPRADGVPARQAGHLPLPPMLPAVRGRPAEEGQADPGGRGRRPLCAHAATTPAVPRSSSITSIRATRHSRFRMRARRAVSSGRAPKHGNASYCARTVMRRWKPVSACFRLPGVDSNHQELINSQSCCRYITGERRCRA